MKASKLIEELQKLISEHGDLDISVNDNEWGPCDFCGVEYIDGRKSNPFSKEIDPATFLIH